MGGTVPPTPKSESTDFLIVFAMWRQQHVSASYTWFLGSTPVCSCPENDISIGSAVFAELTIMINKQTDRQTDSNSPHLYALCIIETSPISVHQFCIFSHSEFLLRRSYVVNCNENFMMFFVRMRDKYTINTHDI